MTTNEKIAAFVAGDRFAVVGASSNRQKYGNKVLRVYLQRGFAVHPVNPGEREIEGLTCYPDLAALPAPVHGVSIVTPPHVTAAVLRQAAALGVRHVWMQPGAEPNDWPQLADELGLVAVGGGPCILVKLGYREE